MLEGISTFDWVTAALVAATGAVLIALIRRRGLRHLLLCLWLLTPGVVVTFSSSFDSLGAALQMLLFFLVLLALPWSAVSLPVFLFVRLVARLRHRQTTTTGPVAEEGRTA